VRTARPNCTMCNSERRWSGNRRGLDCRQTWRNISERSHPRPTLDGRFGDSPWTMGCHSSWLGVPLSWTLAIADTRNCWTR
jgi:hypothetical protein